MSNENYSETLLSAVTSVSNGTAQNALLSELILVIFNKCNCFIAFYAIQKE